MFIMFCGNPLYILWYFIVLWYVIFVGFHHVLCYSVMNCGMSSYFVVHVFHDILWYSIICNIFHHVLWYLIVVCGIS